LASHAACSVGSSTQPWDFGYYYGVTTAGSDHQEMTGIVMVFVGWVMLGDGIYDIPPMTAVEVCGGVLVVSGLTLSLLSRTPRHLPPKSSERKL
jgi:hypothetical protein